MKKLFLIILLVSTVFTSAFAEKKENNLKDILAELAKIKTYTADLKQVTAYVGFGEDEFNGKVFLKTAEKAAWVYNTPHRQFYYILPERIEYYDSEMEQLTKISLTNDKQADVLKQLMLDISSISKNFDITLENNVMSLKPKTKMDTDNIKITVENNVFTRITSVDSSGNITDIKFSNIIINQPVDESKYDLTIPKGTETIVQ